MESAILAAQGGTDPTRFVLVGTSHAGNVGAAARAMKVMGYADLVLVAPRYPDVTSHEEAQAMASGALDVLEGARVVATLAEALDGVTVLDTPVAAFDADVVLTMLANDDAVRRVVIDSGAMAKAPRFIRSPARHRLGRVRRRSRCWRRRLVWSSMQRAAKFGCVTRICRPS